MPANWCSTPWLGIDSLGDAELPGLNSWRFITYNANPKNLKKANEIRELIVNARPYGQAKTMSELKAHIIQMDAAITQYNEAAQKPLETASESPMQPQNKRSLKHPRSPRGPHETTTTWSS